MSFLRRVDTSEVQKESAPALERVCIDMLLTRGSPLCQDDVQPDEWPDVSVLLADAADVWADRLGLGAVSCSHLSESTIWSERYPLDDEDRNTSAVLDHGWRHSTLASLCANGWILLTQVSAEASRRLLAAGAPVDRFDVVEVPDRTQFAATLAWGPWCHEAPGEPSARVVPARVDLLRCCSDGWQLSVGEVSFAVSEPFALEVLARHR